MPPKKKKQAKNAFYYFLLEFREEAVKNGRNVDSPSFEEEADREWRNLCSGRRLHYEEIALEKRRKIDNLENKFTTTGVSYAQLHREEMKKIRQEEMMRNEIETTVRSLTENTLKTKVFHFIHVNTYCRLLDGHFLPCEIGIAKFTFENGVKDSYHTIINLECIPTGYFLECQKNSEESHQIPLPPENTLGEWDSEKVLVQIEAFLADNESYPPVYTLQSNIEASQDTLNTFAGCKDTFRVYPISRLLYELRNACAKEAGGVGFPVLSLAEREFEKDFFNLSPGISCFYHEGMDACQYCSLSIVKRWCFLFASLGCPDLGIALKPGSHKPRKITLPPAPPEPMTSKSQVSLRKGKKGASATDPPPITIIDYSGSKLSLECADDGTKSDCPLAQFGTYIRASAEEDNHETKLFKNSQTSFYPAEFSMNKPHFQDQNFLMHPENSEKEICQDNEQNVVYCAQNKNQHFYLESDSEYRSEIKTVSENENLYHPSYCQIDCYEESNNINQNVNNQTHDLYNTFVDDVHVSLPQNIQDSSKQSPDVFDIYIDSMFQPRPMKKQPPDETEHVNYYSASPWNFSCSSLTNTEPVSSSTSQENRSLFPICGADVGIGHGRGLPKKQNVLEKVSFRPGGDNLCAIKKTSPQKIWDQNAQQPQQNGTATTVRMPGRGRGRARGLSLLLE